MPVMVPPYPPKPVGAPSADNGYSIENIRASNEVCPVCRHEDPAPRWLDLDRGKLRKLLAEHIAGLSAGDYDDDPELWLSELGAILVRHRWRRGTGPVAVAIVTCSACGWHYRPAALSLWLRAATAVATGGGADPAGAGGQRSRAPGDDPAPDPARVSGEDGARLASPLDGSALIELLGRIEDLDERVHQAEQTTAATVQALADERRSRRDALEAESRRQAEITTATTGVLLELREQIGRAGEQIAELRETAEQLRAELASLYGYVKALEEQADAADQTRNELRDLEVKVSELAGAQRVVASRGAELDMTQEDHEERITALEQQVRR